MSSCFALVVALLISIQLLYCNVNIARLLKKEKENKKEKKKLKRKHEKEKEKEKEK